MSSSTRPRPPWLRRRPAISAPEAAPPPPTVAHDPYATQVISPRVIARLYRLLVWAGLAASFSVSVIGNLRPFGGDLTQLANGDYLNWAYLTTPALRWALGGAAVYQVIIQVCQFRFALEPARWRMYLLLIVASVAPSLYTFAPLIAWANDQYRIGYVWLYAGVALALGLNDFMQEQALQKRG